MDVFRVRNEFPGILITCPHCKFGSRYDGSYIEDAIKIRHDIVCVACGGEFNLVVSPIEKAAEHSASTRNCPRCDGRGKVRSTSNSDVMCPLCKGAGTCK